MSNASSRPFWCARRLSVFIVSPRHVAQIEVDRVEIQFARFDLGKIQNVVDQREQRIRGHLRQSQILALFGVELRVEHQFRHAHDAVHGRADFMAHVGQEFALGAVGRFGRFLGALQIRFGFLAVGDVDVHADDFGDVSLFIQDRAFSGAR